VLMILVSLHPPLVVCCLRTGSTLWGRFVNWSHIPIRAIKRTLVDWLGQWWQPPLFCRLIPS